MVGKFYGKKSSLPTTNCALMNPFWRTQRKSNLKKNENGGGAKEVDETNYGFRPSLGHSMGIQHNQKEKEEGRAKANDYVPLEMPFLKKPPICAADKKLKKAKFAGGNEDEGEYEEIDNFVVDIFRLKNRELLKNMQNKNGKSENKINGMENAANKFGGSAKNIFTKSKEGLPRQFCRSTLDLNFYYKNSPTEDGQINGKMISPTILPAPFPTTMNAHKSTVAGKSCKQQIVQQQFQRSMSPECPKKTLGQFNRTISCQNLNNDNFELQNSVKYGKQNVWRRGSHANNEFEDRFSAADKFGAESSSMNVLQRFPKMRIEPAPNLPKRQSDQNGKQIVGKMMEENANKNVEMEEEKDGAWRKAEINLQKLINTLEEKANSSNSNDTGYIELPLKNAINKNANNENDYDELGQIKWTMAENKQSKILNMELENEYDEIGWQNIYKNGTKIGKNFTINNFLDKFLTSKIREMALWMCEADCQAFGWPPSKWPGQQSYFWSIDENGAKIRRQIAERSNFIQNLVSNSFDYPKSSSMEILEKWIELAKELFNEFGNIFAFMNIFGILMEKMMGKFPVIFKEFENQQLVAAFNSIKNGDKIEGNSQILLPFIQPYFDELFDGKLEEYFEESNLNAKIDFLWTMTKLGRKMFAKMKEKCAKNEGDGKLDENIFSFN